MELYLLRHAIAVERGTAGYDDDSLRPLTPEGRTKMRRAAEGMKALKLTFDLILSSPYVRARATAEIVGDVLGRARKLQFTDLLQPEGDAKALLDTIGRTKKRVLLVGHEPYLSQLIGRLICHDPSVRLNLKKGGLAKLTADRLEFGPCAELEFLLTPRQLRASAA